MRICAAVMHVASDAITVEKMIAFCAEKLLWLWHCFAADDAVDSRIIVRRKIVLDLLKTGLKVIESRQGSEKKDRRRKEAAEKRQIMAR